MSLLNPIISLPITTAFQRAEAESLIASRMQNKQYRPLRSSLPFTLPLLNPKVSIHEAHAP